MPSGRLLVCAAIAISFIVLDWPGLPLTLNRSTSHSRSPSPTSSRCAAIFCAFARILRAAIAAAAPPTGVEREPQVPAPYGALSVSPSSIWISSDERPSSVAMICAYVVAWPWPWLIVPSRAIALPVGLTRMSQLSKSPMPRMSQTFVGPAPTISVNVEIPMPISSPFARFSACSLRSAS